MRGAEATTRASLLAVWKVRPQDGSSLPMGWHVHRPTQPQAFLAIPVLLLDRLARNVILYGLQ